MNILFPNSEKIKFCHKDSEVNILFFDYQIGIRTAHLEKRVVLPMYEIFGVICFFLKLSKFLTFIPVIIAEFQFQYSPLVNHGSSAVLTVAC